MKLFFLAVCLLGGNVVLATPEADAAYAAQRYFEPAELEALEEQIKDALVTVYYRPLSELGIDLIDRERFIDLIPDDDVAHYIDRILARTAEKYLSVYTPEKLAALAGLLRTDSELRTMDVLSDTMRERYLIALEEARKQTTSSGSENQLVLELEEKMVQLESFAATYGDEGLTGPFALFRAPSMVPLLLFGNTLHTIKHLEPDLDNPAILAVLREDGIFRFVNPVQQQTLLRQLEPSKNVGGIRFQKPPQK
ncbi:MAG: hypothetical protein ABJN14_15850 [Paracoccaceae bacterium]